MNGRVDIIAGTLGGGKSLYGVERIYFHLLKGGVVYTNIETYPEEIAASMRERYYLEFNPSRLRQLPKTSLRGFHDVLERGTAEMPVMVVLDEAALEWNAKDWAKTSKDDKGREMLNFVTLVRKLDILLLFIAQNPVGIDKSIRDKAQIMTLCVNYRYFQIMGLIPLPIPLMRRVHFDVSVGSKVTKQWSEFIFSRSWVFPLYNSDALLGENAEMFEALNTAETGELRKLEVPKIVKWRRAELVAVFVVCLILFA